MGLRERTRPLQTGEPPPFRDRARGAGRAQEPGLSQDRSRWAAAEAADKLAEVRLAAENEQNGACRWDCYENLKRCTPRHPTNKAPIKRMIDFFLALRSSVRCNRGLL